MLRLKSRSAVCKRPVLSPPTHRSTQRCSLHSSGKAADSELAQRIRSAIGSARSRDPYGQSQPERLPSERYAPSPGLASERRFSPSTSPASASRPNSNVVRADPARASGVRAQPDRSYADRLPLNRPLVRSVTADSNTDTRNLFANIMKGRDAVPREPTSNGASIWSRFAKDRDAVNASNERRESPSSTQQRGAPTSNDRRQSPLFSQQKESSPFGERKGTSGFGQRKEVPLFGDRKESPLFGDRRNPTRESPLFGSQKGSSFFGDRKDTQTPLPRQSFTQKPVKDDGLLDSWAAWNKSGGGDRDRDRDRRVSRQQDSRPSANRFKKDVAAPSPSRFTVHDKEEYIGTRERGEDPRYQKRVAAREKERGRNRKFDDEESGILEEEEEGALSAKELRKQKKAKAAQKQTQLMPLFLPQFISVSNLASMLGQNKLERFTSRLRQMGFEETNHDHVMDAENAGLIAQEFGYEVHIDQGESKDLKPRPQVADKSVLPTRPPIVTIMGHVDHGKTTLLDWLRKSSIVDSEFGGITQHIGAFSVKMPSGKVITFLDTPGHAAFLSMRERGANVTDIVILVVAADDSVKPQTLEAIKHAKSANVPIIVAINKIDKEGADPERVKQDLARYEVYVEDTGGDVQAVCVSGMTGRGMEELEEATVTLGEILDHRAEVDGLCEGWVLEATTKKRGKVATVLITRGTLKPGDIMVAGRTWTRVKTLMNEHGEEVPSAGPGTPVEIDGWRDQPEAGDMALQAETEDRAKTAVEYRIEKFERIQLAIDMEAINKQRKEAREKEEHEQAVREQAIALGIDPDQAVLDANRKLAKESRKTKEVGFIVKADVSGSTEAVVDSISHLGNEEVKSKIVRSSFGSVTEFDVDHAAAAGAYILAFNLPRDPQIYQYARIKGVSILDHNVIYRLVDDVKAKLSEQLAPRITYNVTGEALIAQIFNFKIKGKKFKPYAGCRVTNGVVARNSKVRVLRGAEKKIVFDGSLESLKNVKKDALQMQKGSECGIGFEGWSDFQEGDQIQCYETITEKRYLD